MVAQCTSAPDSFGVPAGLQFDGLIDLTVCLLPLLFLSASDDSWLVVFLFGLVCQLMEHVVFARCVGCSTGWLTLCISDTALILLSKKLLQPVTKNKTAIVFFLKSRASSPMLLK